MRSNSTALRIRVRKSPKPPSPSSQDDVDVEQSFRRPPASFLVAVARFASRDDARLYRYDAAHASPASETSLPREIRSKGSPSASVMFAGYALRADQQSVRVMLDPFMVNSWAFRRGRRTGAWHGKNACRTQCAINCICRMATFHLCCPRVHATHARRRGDPPSPPSSEAGQGPYYR